MNGRRSLLPRYTVTMPDMLWTALAAHGIFNAVPHPRIREVFFEAHKVAYAMGHRRILVGTYEEIVGVLDRLQELVDRIEASLLRKDDPAPHYFKQYGGDGRILRRTANQMPRRVKGTVSGAIY